MTIVMGLDQHRAQITADWLDSATGEAARGWRRRRFLKRFRGRELKVALEATTGWRLSSRSCGGSARPCIWPSRPRPPARRGNKKRAKNDRADARHLREVLMVERLPESWIAPDHLLDLRARVRLRHSLAAQRGEWQQRIQAVLYHHGFPRRRNLMTEQGAGGWPRKRCRPPRPSRSWSRWR